MRIRFSTRYNQWGAQPFQRQSPGRTGRWEDAVLLFDEPPGAECDFWVVFDGLARRETAKCPPENTLFITAEPPGITEIFKPYDPRILAQFATVLTCERSDIQHQHVVRGQQGIPWEVGRKLVDGKHVGFEMDYDSLSAMSPPAKNKCMSVIASNKTMVEGQVKRLRFAQRLKEHFKDKIDLFGKGIREIPDKWDALKDYKYHVAIENSAVGHYWTEKLADAFLGWTLPIYHGCPNLSEYFSSESYLAVDVDQIEHSIRVIEQAVESDQYALRLPAIGAVRDLVLNRYNFVPSIVQWCKKLDKGGSRRRIVLRHRFDSMSSRVIQRLRTYMS